MATQNFEAVGGNMGPVSEEELTEASVAPRVTLDDLRANIAHEHYFTAYEGVLGQRFHHEKGEVESATFDVPESLSLLTFCVLTLRNGFTVIGTSACASPANFNREIGQRIARDDAERQIWPLMGYQLRESLFLAQGA